jgi:general secretion pathway protein G
MISVWIFPDLKYLFPLIEGSSGNTSPQVHYFSSRRKRYPGRKGFTLLELMIVIAILAVLGAIAVPQYKSYADRATYHKLIQTMRMIDREISVFNITTGRFPENLGEVNLGYLRDPWNNSFRYLNVVTARNIGQVRKNRNLVPINLDYDLYSMGPDGQSKAPLTARQSQDDIIRAENGSFFGRASDY